MNITEGLRQGDLEGVVLPLVSIDEYESKIASYSEIAVAAFYVKNDEAGYDMMSFLDRSTIPILDSDVSPAPNEDGNFLVFVELERNKEFSKWVYQILQELVCLTNLDVDQWEMRIYGRAPEDFNVKRLKRFFVDHIEEEPSLEEQVQTFFKNSFLNQVIISESKLTLSAPLGNFEFGSFAFEEDCDGSICFDERSLTECVKLGTLLGSHWDVTKVNDIYVVSHPNNDKKLLLKK